jgi:hypothetical protein
MIMISSILTVQQQYQIAYAFPCVGEGVEEYCTGYHDGAIQAHRDYNSGNNLGIDHHPCTSSADYCGGYNRGYSDEVDFLG